VVPVTNKVLTHVNLSSMPFFSGAFWQHHISNICVGEWPFNLGRKNAVDSREKTGVDLPLSCKGIMSERIIL